MPEILIELDEADLREVEAIAETEKRSRRAQISRIIEEWLVSERKRVDEGLGKEKA